MRRMVLTLAVVCLAVAVVGSSALAQDERPERARMRTFQEQMRPQPVLTKEVMDRIISQLDLSEEQEEKVAEIKKEFLEKIEAHRKKAEEEGKALQEQMQEARKEENREKMAELMQKRRQLMAAGGELHKEFVEALKGLLNDAQKKKLEALLQPPVPAGVVLGVIRQNAEALKLTDTQSEEINKLAEQFKPTRPGEGGDAQVRELMKKVEEMRQAGADEQEIQKVREQIRERAAKAREQAQQRDREAMEKIEKILTKEQLDQVRELLRKRPAEGAPGPERAPGQRPESRRRPGGAAEGGREGGRRDRPAED